jgi:hypothetical protein
MPNPRDYVAIELWGLQMGSYRYYRLTQQYNASLVDAPIDAIFERYDSNGPTGEWATVSSLAPDHPFRGDYERYLALLEMEKKSTSKSNQR